MNSNPTSSTLIEAVSVPIKSSPCKEYLAKDEADDVDRKAKNVKVRKGHVMLYVGKEKRRYEVPLKCLSLPSFRPKNDVPVTNY